MRGHKEGLARLDLSADGFWDSFFAVVLALPPLLLAWMSMADMLSPAQGGKLSVILRLALIDLADWIVPLAVFAFAARPLGLGGRFVHYVVASNWGGMILVWISLPIALLRLLMPDATALADVLSLGLFVVSMVLLWRLTHVALGRDAGTATAVFLGLMVISLFVLIGLQSLLGIEFSGYGSG